MKKALKHTKCTVKLRKLQFTDGWYLMIESYPVFTPGNDKPQRKFEAVNRIITTPIWDKSRNARTDSSGNTTYKPKRDANGIIMCRSEADKEACIYADKVRAIRQREYDNAALYTDSEAQQAEFNEKSQCNFIDYFEELIHKRHSNSSGSIIVNWKRVHALLKIFADGDTLYFYQIDNKLIEDFRHFMLTAPQGGCKSGNVSRNTASTYFSIFKAALKQAFVDGYFTVDLAAKVKNIPEEETRREYVTLEELNLLAKTPCDNPVIKNAALFSALTGLRHCDIKKLTWSEIAKVDGGSRLDFRQKKTKGVEYNPISEQALQLCGPRRDPDQLVFEDLPKPSWISKPLARWIKAAGITRHITFHCFRHTYATLQLANGTDIYTVSKMLGHTNVRTTQIYAKVVDEKKDKAANAIKINFEDSINE